MILLAVYALILVVSVLLTAQAVFTLGLMLYTWARPERLEESGSPDEYLPPSLSFTAILPARNEEGVIGHTVRQVWESDYPKDLLEVVVVCEAGDVGTIEEAEAAAAEIGHPGVRVVAFDAGEGPVNKPRGLNVAFEETSNEVVTIFDAEDDVHPEIFDVINTTMQQKNASIVQAGVQLMDFRSSWYSTQNVLEYFFYFKSRLHYHARVGMIPLGGNTVFIRRALIERVGGWDEACLTEDADVGIRLSVQGEKIAVTYDARHATREETPDSLVGFVKQRTRWCQGFFQVFRKGDWRKLPTRGQRLLAAYSMTYPYFQAAAGALWIPAVLTIIYLEVPVVLAMISLLPLYMILFQLLVGLIGLQDFASAYGLRLKGRDFARYALGFLPYQLLLSVSALRAVFREFKGATNWEKTAHSGVHRTPTEVKAVHQGTRPIVDAAGAAMNGAAVNSTGTTNGTYAGDAVTSGAAANGTKAYAASPHAGSFDALFDEAETRLGVRRGSVMVLDPEKRTFSVKASRGLPQGVAGSAVAGADEGVAGWAVRNKSMLIIDGQHGPDELCERLNQPDLVSSIVVPVQRQGDTVAVVSLSSKDRKLRREDLDWLNERAGELLKRGPEGLAA
ncbi:MAG: glycosyltransferase [Actinomycetota bacterium]|nr:glycosyltransferase [Actinomycetota bacterium]